MPRGIYKRSEELRKRLALAVSEVKKPLNEFYFPKGNIPWNKGKKDSQVPWNKGLKNAQNFSAITGANHYNWKGGITKERVKICLNPDFLLIMDVLYVNHATEKQKPMA